MRRLHFSSSPITDLTWGYLQKEPRSKPRGFWYSCSADWLRWMRSETPDWIPKQNFYVYEIKVNLSRIAVLDSVEKIRAFDRAYGTGPEWDGNSSVRWVEVAELYDGIEICPYQWDLRMSSLSWYYPWDAASGAIWRPNALQAIRLIHVFHPTRRR